MSNLSYCRFHNTKGDLEDCLSVFEDYETIHSESEQNSAQHIFERIGQFLEDQNLIEELPSDFIDRIKEMIKERVEEDEEDEE